MRNVLLFTLASSLIGCIPPGGSWANWGTAGGGGGNNNTGGTGAPPPSPNLAATGSAKQLQRLTHDDRNNETEVVVSADGKWLLYTQTTFYDDGSVASNRIMRTKADGRGGGVTLSKESGKTTSPAWLPSGSAYLAITDAMGSRDIVKSLRVAPNAAMSRVLSGRDIAEADAVSVSPDGTHIAFHSKVGDVWTIGISRVDGSELTHLLPGSFPSWSPDGRQIAFQRFVSGRWQLFITDAEGGELTQLSDGDADDEHASWSPDGKWLAFVSNRGAKRFPNVDASALHNVYAIRADGSGLVALTEGARSNVSPEWGRDGKIYFGSNEAGTFDLWRLEPDKSALATAQ
jgi:TolB protein